MSNTIKDVLGLEGFKNVRVVAGVDRLSNAVSTVSLMEVPDIFPYLEEGTLVLTTLYPIISGKDKLDGFIGKLSACGAAGIGIKTRRYVDEIPQELIEQANEAGFPLLELPAEANLSTMANQILSLSLNEHITQLQFLNHISASLSNLLLNDSSIEELVSTLGTLIKKNVCVLDEDLTVICAASCDGESILPESLADTIDESYLTRNKRELLVSKQMHPIIAGKHRFGYVFVPDYPYDPDERHDLNVAIEQSAIVLATLFLKRDAVVKNQKNFRDVFIRDLLQGKIKDQFEIANKMKAFSVSMTFPQAVVCMKAFIDDERARQKFYDRIINTKLVKKRFESLQNNLDKHVYLVYFNDAVVILGGVECSECLEELYRDILDDLKRLMGLENAKIGVGISDSCDKVEDLCSAYTQAMSVLKTGGILNRESFVDTYAKHRVFSIIESVEDVDTLRRFVSEKIGKLIRYDEENGTNLMETLGFLIDGNLNYKQVAEKSFVHYNTVRYRVGKIEQLGISLNPGRDFSEVVIAFDAWVWLQAMKESD